MEICAVEYENVIYELDGITYLLNCVSQVMLVDENESMYHALQALCNVICRNTQQLEAFMEKQKSST